MKKTVLIAAIAVVGLAAFLAVQKWISATSAAASETKRQMPDHEIISAWASGAGFETGQAGRLRYMERVPLPEPTLPELDARLVPSHLHPLFGWEEIGGYVPRRRMVESLGRNLSKDEVRALQLFVRSRPEEVALSESDFNGVGDVVLLKLEEQGKLHPDYSDHLVVMFYDESLNFTWRDYCIQHLGTVYRRVPEEKRPVIRQLYLDTLEPGGRFAGTTLLSMKRSAGTPDLTKGFVAEKAMEVASSGAFGDAERLSALHVAADFGHPEALVFARRIAGSTQSAVFRSASLAVIGLNGNETDRPLLERYVKSSDIRLRVAAAEALKKLGQK
jgi:hypothetical protein